MSNYDIALQLFKIMQEHSKIAKSSAKTASKFSNITEGYAGKTLIKDTFEKGSKINEKSTCI